MRFVYRSFWALTLSLALHSAVLGAETAGADTPATGPLPGHSSHGEAFDEGPRQAAVLIPGCGKVHLEVTTKHDLAQQFFDQGLAQLHGFWYFEAERSFRQAASIDPQCAMAYWGMAWANLNNEKRAKPFAAEALKHRAAASPREVLYIDATADYFDAKLSGDKPTAEAAKPAEAKPADTPKTTDAAKPAETAKPAEVKKAAPPKRSEADRRKQYVKRMENICGEYPDDIEAQALLVVFLWQSRDKGIPITSHQALDAMIEQVLTREPMHPVHHYRIHLWDDEQAKRAIPAAARCGPAAPAVAHMWHMPGHTYSKLHRYFDAAWQQEAAARVDHAYMIRNRIMPDEIHNYAHNEEWFNRTLALVGRAHEAVDLAKNMIEMPRHPKYNKFGKSGTTSTFGRTRLIETLRRYELWDEAIALAETPYLDPTSDRLEQAKRLRLLGAAHFALGNTTAGNEQLTALETLLQTAQRERDEVGEKAEAKARTEKKPNENEQALTTRATKARNDAKQKENGKVDPLEQAVAELKGHVAHAAKDYKAALEHFGRAKMSQEFLSRVHLDAGDAAKAEELARKAATKDDQQVYPWANLADVLHRAGKADEAANALGKLRAVSSSLDMDLPVVRRLKPLVEANNLPADWRRPHKWADDVGQRPAFDTLGPVRWQPPIAPTFQLATADGREVALEDYRGRPVIVIFYLGHGCLHCVKQLQAFGPMAEKYRAAGIELLAVSTDPTAELQKSIEAVSSEGKYPIPLLANPSLATFRAWRAYDDFEKASLHNTTLLDGQGRILWQDISAEPFMEAQFLLEESQRLLRLYGQAKPAESAVTAQLTVKPALTAAEPARKRVLLLGQAPDGHPPGTHEYFAGHKLMAQLLSRVPNLEVEVVDAGEPWTAGPEMLAKADGAVLFLAEGAAWVSRDPRRHEALTQLAARGGGLVAWHWGIGTKKAENIEPYLQLIGGCHGGPDRKYRVVEATASPALPLHAIATGVEPFTTREEWYYQLKFVAPPAVDSTARLRPVIQVPIDGAEQTVAWAWERPDGGRSFGFSGLHFHDNWRLPAYRRLLAHSVVWSLGLTIPDSGIELGEIREEVQNAK